MDWTRLDDRFDVVVDFEARLPLHRVRRRIARNGRYSVTGGSLPVIARTLAAAGITAVTPGGRMGLLLWKPHQRAALQHLMAEVVGGRLRAVIDSTFQLERTADAFRRFASGDFVGKVVVTVSGAGSGDV
jgi:NADPH:quinone reductase-like Zn-dependent oxidoreductase